MKDNLTRFYVQLTPEERFKLALDATARNDLEMAKALGDSCSRKNYEMLDAAFTDLWQASRMVSLVFGLTFERDFAQTIAANAVVTTARLLVEVHGDAEHKAMLEEAETVFRRAVGELRATYGAFIQFCNKVDVGPEKMMIWYPTATLDEAKDYLDLDVPADQESQEELYSIFCRLWPPT